MEQILIMTETTEFEGSREDWDTLCENKTPAQRYDRERGKWRPNAYWTTLWVKDAYGNTWSDFTMTKYKEFSEEGIPLCIKVEGEWVPNEAWKNNVYWE